MRRFCLGAAGASAEMNRAQDLRVAVEPELLSRADAARFLSLSLRSIDDLIRRHELQPIRVPGMRRFAFRVQDLRAAVSRWATLSDTDRAEGLRNGPGSRRDGRVERKVEGDGAA